MSVFVYVFIEVTTKVLDQERLVKLSWNRYTLKNSRHFRCNKIWTDFVLDSIERLLEQHSDYITAELPTLRRQRAQCLTPNIRFYFFPTLSLSTRPDPLGLSVEVFRSNYTICITLTRMLGRKVSLYTVPKLLSCCISTKIRLQLHFLVFLLLIVKKNIENGIREWQCDIRGKPRNKRRSNTIGAMN